MAKMEVKMEHKLGAAEAMRRIRAGVDLLRQDHGSLVNELVWTNDGGRVSGKGFEGTLLVTDTEVTVNANLGFPANLMPMKARREGEAWLRAVLG